MDEDGTGHDSSDGLYIPSTYTSFLRISHAPFGSPNIFFFGKAFQVQVSASHFDKHARVVENTTISRCRLF
jgi:hypothetical protein